MNIDFQQLDADANSGKEIHLFFSGGSDSAILASIFAKRYPHVPVTLVTIRNSPLYLAAAKRLKDVFFPTYNHYVMFDCPPDTEVLRPHMRDYVQSVGAEGKLFYTAVTNVPDVNIEGRAPVRITPEDYEVHKAKGLRAPFLLMNKLEVTELATEYAPKGMLEFTQSCSAAAAHCGGCWPCRERKWAFEANGFDFLGRKQ